MKIEKQKKSKAPIIIIFLIIAIAIAVGAYYLLFIHNKPSNDSPPNPGESTSSSAKDSSSDTITTDSPNDSTSKDTPDGSKPASGDPISVTILYNDVMGDIVRVQSQIDEILPNGNCTIKFKKGSSVIERSAPVSAQSSYSVCQNFDVPTNEFSPGIWDFTLTVQTDSGRHGETSGRISL